MVGSVTLAGVDYGRKARGNDDSFDAGSVLLDRLEDSSGSNVGWVEEFLPTVSALLGSSKYSNMMISDTFWMSVTLKWKGEAV